MKFKVYEVKAIRIEDKCDYEQSFLYADYEDAVAKFKELVEAEKNVDWIEEGLFSDDERYKLFENVDFWGFYAESLWNDWRSEVTIIEREVF
jgi:hypothetical protein